MQIDGVLGWMSAGTRSCCNWEGADRLTFPLCLQLSAHLLYKDLSGTGVERRELCAPVGRGQELGALGGASLCYWVSVL